MNLLTPSSLAAAAENARDKAFRGGIADLPGGLTGSAAVGTTWRYSDEFLLEAD
jgi:hypothetical protein